jgi:nicotinamidase-related amidase
MPHVSSPHRLGATRSALLVIDFQEKLAPQISSADAIERQILRLVQVAQLLAVPSAATVQYPKGLGPLVPSLRQFFSDPEDKQDFSAAVCRRALDLWARERRDQIVVVGVEAHVCVQQTVLDLLAEGLRPFVVADGIGSRYDSDHQTALKRMRDHGATVTSAESVMFEWLGTSDRPEFKEVSRIVKS